MKNQKNKIEDIFKHYENQWDIYDLNDNHEERFIRKQNSRYDNRTYYFPIAVAASILLLVGIFLVTSKNDTSNNFKRASAETQKTDSIFNVMLQYELTKVKEKKSPLTEKIVNDALSQMEKMEKDCEKIKQELVEKGENRQIIFALIQNYKVRIDFLESVLQQLNNTEKLTITTDEKTI
jgi:phosphoglycerol transferase MdoB-like AlkP superfamily enzyme